jgi:hypothetical protein
MFELRKRSRCARRGEFKALRAPGPPRATNARSSPEDWLSAIGRVVQLAQAVLTLIRGPLPNLVFACSQSCGSHHIRLLIHECVFSEHLVLLFLSMHMANGKLRQRAWKPKGRTGCKTCKYVSSIGGSTYQPERFTRLLERTLTASPRIRRVKCVCERHMRIFMHACVANANSGIVG